MLLYCRKQCVVGCFSWHNKLHAKYLSASCCLWLCRPTADTCNPAQWKQAWDGGWMTDTHCSWHPCTQALKGDWQGFAHESRGKWISGMQWHVLWPRLTDQSMSNPNISLPTGTEMETSLSLSISTKAEEILWHCAKLTSLDHTHTPVQFTTHLWLKSLCVQIRICWQLTPSHARCWRVKKGHKHLCVPEGNCALNVILQPCCKVWPFRKVATDFKTKQKKQQSD